MANSIWRGEENRETAAYTRVLHGDHWVFNQENQRKEMMVKFKENFRGKKTKNMFSTNFPQFLVLETFKYYLTKPI